MGTNAKDSSLCKMVNKMKPRGPNPAVSVKRQIAKAPLPLNLARPRLPRDMVNRPIGKSALSRRGPGP